MYRWVECIFRLLYKLQGWLTLFKYPIGTAMRLIWSEAAKKERLPNLVYKWLVTKPGIYSGQSEK